MSMFDAFGTISSSIAAVSISRRGGLCSGGQSQHDADRKLGEHVVKVDTLTVNCLKAWEVIGGFQINVMFVAVFCFFLAASRYACKCYVL